MYSIKSSKGKKKRAKGVSTQIVRQKNQASRLFAMLATAKSKHGKEKKDLPRST